MLGPQWGISKTCRVELMTTVSMICVSSILFRVLKASLMRQEHINLYKRVKASLHIWGKDKILFLSAAEKNRLSSLD